MCSVFRLFYAHLLSGSAGFRLFGALNSYLGSLDNVVWSSAMSDLGSLFLLFGANIYLGALDFACLEFFFLSGCSRIRLIGALICLSGRSGLYFLSTCSVRPFSC